MKKKLKGLISSLLNFLCAFLVAAIIFVAAGAFVAADENIKSKAGSNGSNIFAYTMKTDTKATLTAFGQQVTIDYGIIAEVGRKIKQLGKLSDIYTPDIVSMAGDAIADIFGITMRPIFNYLYDIYDKYAVKY